MSRRPHGYTLLEMVVVMAILALATSLVAPPSYRMVRSWQEATQLDDTIQQLERLPTRARRDGIQLDVPTDSDVQFIELPDGWSLRMNSPLRVLANGACSDADALLTTSHQSIPLRIQAPFCRISRLDQ